MGHDKVEHKEEVRERTEAKGEFHEKAAEDAHGKDAFKSVQTEKIETFTDGKIDKVEKIDGKPVTAKEREAMKDIAHAIAEGNLDKLAKVVDNLDEKTAKRVAEGLNKAMGESGVHVHYDGNKGDGMHPAIEVIAGDKKVMVPLDGGGVQVGNEQTFYQRPERGSHEVQVNPNAKASDLKDACKALKDAQQKDEKKKQAAGLY